MIEIKNLKKLIQDGKLLRDMNNIIIDLRGNGGGNSQWGDDYKHFKSIYEKMKLALHEGNIFVSDDTKPSSKIVQPNSIKPQFLGHLWVLTDHQCFSSCLLFMYRMIRLLPNVTLIGIQTNADTAYMEVAPTVIANGLAQLLHPIKVNRAEYRKNNRSSNRR